MNLLDFIVVVSCIIGIKTMKKIAPKNRFYIVWAIAITSIYLFASLYLQQQY